MRVNCTDASRAVRAVRVFAVVARVVMRRLTCRYSVFGGGVGAWMEESCVSETNVENRMTTALGDTAAAGSGGSTAGPSVSGPAMDAAQDIRHVAD